MASGRGFFLNKSLASYQDTRKFNVIEGTVKYEGSGDVYIAAYIDGVQTSGDFPDKLAYKYDHAECNNNAEINFDQGTWEVTVSKVKTAKTKCSVYFTTREQANLISNKIKYFAESDTTNLAYDGTVEDSNLRYIEANPNNYVTFNGEQWRIIGTFKDIDDCTGKLEWRTKIIKTASLGNMAWDIDSANGGASINEWSTSDVKIYLNDTYYPGLMPEAKNMIRNTVWSLGTNGTASFYSATPRTFYEYERSNNTGKICSSGYDCSDTVPRTTTWQGKIGLMYPSDYGYATGGSTRSTCLNIALNSWNTDVNCYNNDWLFNSAYQWTMTLYADSSSSGGVFTVRSDGYVSFNGAYNTNGVHPVLYLSSNVMISSGSGTSIDPFILSV